MADVRRVLVTGATGFAARAVIPALQASGWTVRATSRNEPPSPPNCEFVAADLVLGTDFDRLTEGVHAVVHLAARVHVMRETVLDPIAAFRSANVIATARLAEAAARQGVRQLVFASSVKVNGERTPDRPFTEGDPPRPEDPYGISKLEAERALTEISERTALGVTIFRPPLMYGPGVKGNFERLMRWVKRGVPLPLGAVTNRRSLLYVGNFASAIGASLGRAAPAARVFLVSDGEDLSTTDLVRRIAAASGVRPRLLSVPPPLLRSMARAAGLGAEMQRLTESLVVDTSRIRVDLGWSPPFTLDQGLARSVTNK